MAHAVSPVRPQPIAIRVGEVNGQARVVHQNIVTTWSVFMFVVIFENSGWSKWLSDKCHGLGIGSGVPY